jgi:adenylosuccinate synthase
VSDIQDLDYVRRRLEAVLPAKNHQLEFYGLRRFSVDELLDRAATWRGRFAGMIVDGLPVVAEAIASRKNVLLEGQLGAMRDVDWGIYPYTTASSPTSGGACAGAGIPPRSIDEVLGVVKAYSTAVGGGPFPVEVAGAPGDMLREIGREYGATTGRPRRCGWFDGVAVRHAGLINGFTGIAVTKLDVLDQFDEIPICVGYRLAGERLEYVPDTRLLAAVQPILEVLPGWHQDTSGCRLWSDLPAAARSYLQRIEELAHAPMRFVSVGPERSQIVVR